MTIKKNIFDNFIKKLADNEDFPNEIVSSIKEQWNINSEISKEEILNQINVQDENDPNKEIRK